MVFIMLSADFTCPPKFCSLFATKCSIYLPPVPTCMLLPLICNQEKALRQQNSKYKEKEWRWNNKRLKKKIDTNMFNYYMRMRSFML